MHHFYSFRSNHCKFLTFFLFVLTISAPMQSNCCFSVMIKGVVLRDQVRSFQTVLEAFPTVLLVFLTVFILPRGKFATPGS